MMILVPREKRLMRSFNSKMLYIQNVFRSY